MPTLYEEASGEKLLAMARVFFSKAQSDELLAPLFGPASPDHAEHLTGWFSALFGGPQNYLTERGDLRWVIWSHRNMKISDAQRARWVRLMMDAAAEVEMREAFMRSFDRFADSISRNVQANSHLEEDVLRRTIGYDEE